MVHNPLMNTRRRGLKAAFAIVKGPSDSHARNTGPRVVFCNKPIETYPLLNV